MNPPMLFPLPLSFSQEPHKTTRNFLLLPLNLLGKWEAISLFPHYRLTRISQTNLEILGCWVNGTLGKEEETKGWGGCEHGGLALHCSHICPSTSLLPQSKVKIPKCRARSTSALGRSGGGSETHSFPQQCWCLPTSLATLPALRYPSHADVAMQWAYPGKWYGLQGILLSFPFLKTIFSLNQYSLLTATWLLKVTLAKPPPALAPMWLHAWAAAPHCSSPLPPDMHTFEQRQPLISSGRYLDLWTHGVGLHAPAGTACPGVMLHREPRDPRAACELCRDLWGIPPPAKQLLAFRQLATSDLQIAA